MEQARDYQERYFRQAQKPVNDDTTRMGQNRAERRASERQQQKLQRKAKEMR